MFSYYSQNNDDETDEVNSQGSPKETTESDDSTSTKAKGCSTSIVLTNIVGALGGITIATSYAETTPIKSVDSLYSQNCESPISGKSFSLLY